MNKELFRKEAITRIESPERLNEMVKITSAKTWLALLAIFLIIATAISWSILGSIPHNVYGKGILLQSGGIIEVSSIGNGKIEKTLFEPGSYVIKGQIVANIAQTELQMQLDHTKQKLEEMTRQYNQMVNFGKQNIQMNTELLRKEEDNTIQQIKTNDDRLKFVSDRIKAQEELLKEGLVTKESFNSTKQQFFNIKQENDKLNNALHEIQIKLFELSRNNELTIHELQSRIIDLQNEINEMAERLSLTSEVKSPVNGKIVELMVNPGQVISSGTPILTIEPDGFKSEIEAIIYVSPQEGKKIEKDMLVKLSPSTVEVEEYGYMLGKVKEVSKYPATPQGMLRALGNIDLVKSFSYGVPPIAITVTLEKDSISYSGYKWTSRQGPEIEIKPGTLCNSKVIVETQKPIALLFPKLSQFTKKSHVGK